MGSFAHSRMTPPYRACPRPVASIAECTLIVVPIVPASSPDAVGPALEGSGEGGAWAPSDLRSAYKLPATGGSGQTVAIVDAFDDPNAYSDLTHYRKTYKLSECTEESGCFKKVNQTGETKNYPAGNNEWAGEISLDVDMVSAICPECHILLVEATTNALTNLFAAENEAATLGATEISNSWEGEESENAETFGNTYFDHPGVPITAAGGDGGYGVKYPSASQDVISVGGTRLMKAKNTRGWSEKVWSKTGSGCSLYDAKPRWQTDSGCALRTTNDTAANASELSPVSVYDTYERSGWGNYAGTSVSTPIVASIEALSSSYVRSLGAEAFYLAGKENRLFDITLGSNGSCGTMFEYLCNAEVGYDGPTGMGTPNEVLNLKEGIWASDTPANPKGALESVLGAIACSTASVCMSVGTYATEAPFRSSFSDLWNGSGWTVKTPEVPAEAQGSELLGVSCTSANACTAAGEYISNETKEMALVDRWNGSEWKKQTAPNPTKATATRLNDVSCSSSSSCLAVGYDLNGTGEREPVGEIWNGTSWSLQSVPGPSKGKGARLQSLWCTSSSACTAVGWYEASTSLVGFGERWNGTSWTFESMPNPSGSERAFLNGVSCPTLISCTAVGFYDTSGGTKTLAMRWNGSTWSIETTPNPVGGKSPELQRVSCFSYTECIAVGSYLNSSGEYRSLAERWTGSEWLIQTTPNPTGALAAQLDGVSCLSSVFCTASGTYLNSSKTWVTLAENYH